MAKELRYVCTEHGVHVRVDIEHLAIFAEVDEPHRTTPMPSCTLLTLAHLALDDPQAPLGDHGPWHPLRERPVCHIDAEGEA